MKIFLGTRAYRQFCFLWLLWSLAPIGFSRNFARAGNAATGSAFEVAAPMTEIEKALQTGKAEASKGNYEKALEQYDFALDRLQKVSDTTARADLLSEIAVIQRKLGNFDRSQGLQEQAMKLYAALGDTFKQAKALRRLGVLFRHQGKLFLAIQYQEQALALLEQQQAREGIAQILTNLGIIYSELGRLETAQQYFERALTIYSNLDKQSGVSYILGNLGQLFLYLGDSQQALDYLERSRELKHSLGDVRGEANSLLNIGTAYKNLGDYQKAFTLYYQALETFEQLKDQHGQAVAFGNIGSVYEALGDLERAEQYQKQSLKFKRQSGSPVQVSVALTNLASLAIKQKRFQDAEKSLKEALEIALIHNSLLSQANIYGTMGMAALHQDKFQEALDNFSRAKQRYEQLGSQKGILETIDSVGQVYIKQKRFDKALPYYEEALRLATELKELQALWTGQYHLGQIFLQLGDQERAMAYFYESIASLEQMRSYLELPELREMFLQKHLNPYREMIRLLLERDRAEDALLYLERFKARTFLEMVSYGNTQLRATPKLIKDEQYLAARIRFLNKRLNAPLAAGSAAGFADLQQELEQAQENYEQLLLQIKLQYPEYYRLKIVDAGEIHKLTRSALQLLEDDVAILEYFFDDRQMYIWIIEKDRLHSITVPVSQHAIIERVLRFRSELSEHKSDDIFVVLEELYSWLITPAEPYLLEKEIIGIVPFQILHFIPFAALVKSPSSDNPELPPPAPSLEKRGGKDPPSHQNKMGLGDEFPLKSTTARPEYLIDRYAVFSLPSLSMLPVVRQRLEHNTAQAQGASSHSYLLGIGSRDLPGAEEEIKTLQSYFPESKTYSGELATKETLLQEAGKYQILHLATHGVFDKYHPMFSYLEFSSESFLYAGEIFGLQLLATLVTLSGCETFLPQHIDVEDVHSLVSGDELMGFIRAFMYAGTPSVLASLWRVNDTATQYLMSAFYQNLHELGKAKALQKASRLVMETTLRQGRRTPKEFDLFHPFFWAPFVLIGDWK
ncbi:MAG: tetratricopeptide repeat protein [bacterium]|nr:tetratricopeptide repeat protein [bacterium]